MNVCLHYCLISVCFFAAYNGSAVHVQLFQTVAVMHSVEQGADWTDGLLEAAAFNSSGCTLAGH